MDLKQKLDKMVRINIEVSDLNRVNVEVYSSVENWKNHMYTFVNQQEPHQIRENVQTIGISFLELDDEVSLKRFRKNGSATTFYDMSLETIARRLGEGSYTHVFLENIGELDEIQVRELAEWVDEKLDREK